MALGQPSGRRGLQRFFDVYVKLSVDTDSSAATHFNVLDELTKWPDNGYGIGTRRVDTGLGLQAGE